MPRGILCNDLEAATTEKETPVEVGEGQERNGRLIGLLGLLTGRVKNLTLEVSKSNRSNG